MHEEQCNAVDYIRKPQKKKGIKAAILAAAECVRADIFGVVSQHVIRDVCSVEWCGIEKPG